MLIRNGSSWLFFSLLAAFSTKWILEPASLRKFPSARPMSIGVAFPLFLTLFQMLLCMAATAISGHPRIKSTSEPLNWIVFLKQTLPTGLLLSEVIICWNYSYVYLSVAYIQIMKVPKRRVQDWLIFRLDR